MAPTSSRLKRLRSRPCQCDTCLCRTPDDQAQRVPILLVLRHLFIVNLCCRLNSLLRTRNLLDHYGPICTYPRCLCADSSSSHSCSATMLFRAWSREPRTRRPGAVREHRTVRLMPTWRCLSERLGLLELYYREYLSMVKTAIPLEEKRAALTDLQYVRRPFPTGILDMRVPARRHGSIAR